MISLAKFDFPSRAIVKEQWNHTLFLKNYRVEGWQKKQNDIIFINVFGPIVEAREHAIHRIDTEIPIKSTLLSAASTFVRIAATRTPPRIGKQSLYSSEEERQKMFYRPVLFLPALVKGKLRQFRWTQADLDALRNGFLYKVVDTRRGQKIKAVCYTKTKEEAVIQARIQNRGLAKAMWGINLASIGADPISFIAKIVHESPHLNELRSLNPIYYDGKTVTIGNFDNTVNYNFKMNIARRAINVVKSDLVKGNQRRVSAIVREYLSTVKKIETRAIDIGLQDDLTDPSILKNELLKHYGNFDISTRNDNTLRNVSMSITPARSF